MIDQSNVFSSSNVGPLALYRSQGRFTVIDYAGIEHPIKQHDVEGIPQELTDEHLLMFLNKGGYLEVFKRGNDFAVRSRVRAGGVASNAMDIT